MKRSLTALTTTLVLAACGGSGDTEPPAPAETCVTGIVGYRGFQGEGSATLETRDGGALTLTGAGATGIGRLTGGLVTACGAADDGRLTVARFELREMDGRPGYVGTLLRVDDRLELDPASGDPRVPLADAPDRLARAAGSPVWVSGEWEADAFSVRSFGILPEDARVGS